MSDCLERTASVAAFAAEGVENALSIKSAFPSAVALVNGVLFSPFHRCSSISSRTGSSVSIPGKDVVDLGRVEKALNVPRGVKDFCFIATSAISPPPIFDEARKTAIKKQKQESQFNSEGSSGTIKGLHEIVPGLDRSSGANLQTRTAARPLFGVSGGTGDGSRDLDFGLSEESSFFLLVCDVVLDPGELGGDAEGDGDVLPLVLLFFFFKIPSVIVSSTVCGSESTQRLFPILSFSLSFSFSFFFYLWNFFNSFVVVVVLRSALQVML